MLRCRQSIRRCHSDKSDSIGYESVGWNERDWLSGKHIRKIGSTISP